ncbi:hypothetical protein B0H13DRAFT_1897713 [Mycena leptocephala]|nr:hypothetical protein B0H13DRAFT_1897713 [Mycena leptocephala]
MPHAASAPNIGQYRSIAAEDFKSHARYQACDQSLDDEVNHYMNSSLPSWKSMDMVGYWINHGRTTGPKTFHLLADYAPIQATSMPSECSSSTATRRPQSTAVPDEEEDWLRILASAADESQAEIWREISDSCEAEAGYTEMPTENEN